MRTGERLRKLSKAEEESVRRALTHYESVGTIYLVSPPGGDQTVFRVRMTELDEAVPMTMRECYYLVLGLARGAEVAQRAARAVSE